MYYFNIIYNNTVTCDYIICIIYTSLLYWLYIFVYRRWYIVFIVYDKIMAPILQMCMINALGKITGQLAVALKILLQKWIKVRNNISHYVQGYLLIQINFYCYSQNYNLLLHNCYCIIQNFSLNWLFSLWNNFFTNSEHVNKI